MRAMAENKLKHSGQYKNPTFPLAPGSTMNKPIEFDWKKLANKSQGGEKEVGSKTHWGVKGEYGASPFILHHFSGDAKEYKKGNKKVYPKENDIQRKARMVFTAKNLLAKAKKLADATGTEAPTMKISDLVPPVATEPTKADIIEHFGNVVDMLPKEDKKEVIEHFGNVMEGITVEPKKFKPKKKFVDADTGAELKDERGKKADEPPTPKNEVVETAPPPPPPVVEPVVAKKTKKAKVAETPPPPNPVPRVVWTEEELKKNPIVSNVYYDGGDLSVREEYVGYKYDGKMVEPSKDEREKELLLFALNNPKAKLADAIKNLKEKGIGKGFSSPTISPLYKEARATADLILAEEDKKIKVLSNPQFENIKAKLDSLLKRSRDKPLIALRTALPGVDIDKYLTAYEAFAKKTGDNENLYFYTKYMLVPIGKLWHQWVKMDYGKNWITLDRKFDLGLNIPEQKPYGNPDGNMYYAPSSIEIKDADGKEVLPEVISGGKNFDKVELTLLNLKVDDKKSIFNREVQYIADNDAIVNVKSKEFKSEEDKKNNTKSFYYKELWDYNLDIQVGRLMNRWSDKNAGFGEDHRQDDPEEKRNVERRFKISFMSEIKNAINFRDKPKYVMKIDGHEYIVPNARIGTSRHPDNAPEEIPDPVMPTGEEPPSAPEKWTEENTGALLGKYSEGDDDNWFDTLNPGEKKLALWHLNNDSFEYSFNTPELAQEYGGRWRMSDLRKEVAYLKREFDERRKKYQKAVKAYNRFKAKSKKVRGGYRLNKVSEADAKDPEEIKRLPIRNRERYNRAKANLLEALSNYTVPPVSSRADLLGKESGMMAGKKSGEGILARGVAFGFGNNRKGYHYFVKNKDHPEVYKALVEFGEAIVPKGWDFQTIQLNHNAKARKHIDKNNVGKSVIIGIGDYNGGELRVFSPDSSKHHDYNIKDKPTMFNGAVLPHETQPFSNPTDYERGKGRYTIVYFRHKYKPDSGNVGVGSGHYDTEGEGMGQPSASELEDLFV
jgi:hypothetical protein